MRVLVRFYHAGEPQHPPTRYLIRLRRLYRALRLTSIATALPTLHPRSTLILQLANSLHDAAASHHPQDHEGARSAS